VGPRLCAARAERSRRADPRLRFTGGRRARADQGYGFKRAWSNLRPFIFANVRRATRFLLFTRCVCVILNRARRLTSRLEAPEQNASGLFYVAMSAAKTIGAPEPNGLSSPSSSGPRNSCKHSSSSGRDPMSAAVGLHNFSKTGIKSFFCHNQHLLIFPSRPILRGAFDQRLQTLGRGAVAGGGVGDSAQQTHRRSKPLRPGAPTVRRRAP
jgi:hypothetical protein